MSSLTVIFLKRVANIILVEKALPEAIEGLEGCGDRIFDNQRTQYAATLEYIGGLTSSSPYCQGGFLYQTAASIIVPVANEMEQGTYQMWLRPYRRSLCHRVLISSFHSRKTRKDLDYGRFDEI